MTVNTWPDKKTRDSFFDELRALLERYPNLRNHMVRGYEENPSSYESDSDEDGYSPFDPSSLIFLQGVAVVISYTNLEHYEDLDVLIPYEQSHYLTAGILNHAAVIHGAATSTD